MIRFKVILVILAIFKGMTLSAQGIDFQHITLEEALVKAETENKLIFIDFYTDWCGPCKIMAANVFTADKVGDFYNREFINLKLNAEKEGRSAAMKYRVNSYPTLVFLNSSGDIVLKNSGSKDIPNFVKLGKNAIAAGNSGYGLTDLKSQYESKKHDERFLRLYIQKMVENKEDASDAIENWLNIQTEIKEDDVDMMEFLLNHSKNLIVGGKACEIIDANMDEYMDIATRAEEKTLKKLKFNMVYNTRLIAIDNKKPELMLAFLDSWKTLPDEYRHGNYMDYQLEYFLIAKNYTDYKVHVISYMDSLITAQPLSKIREEDHKSYEEYKTTKYIPGVLTDIRLERYRKGLKAAEQMNAINTQVRRYLKLCVENKSDYKKLHQWIDYGSALIPDDYTMDNLRGDVFVKQGKMKKAIEFKESALSKLSENDRKREALTQEINKMKEGKES